MAELLQAVLAMVEAAKVEVVLDPFRIDGLVTGLVESDQSVSKDMQEFMRRYEARKQLSVDTNPESTKEFFSNLNNGGEKLEEQTTAEMMESDNKDEIILSQNQSLIICVLKRIAHFLSSDNPETRLLVLKTYNAGLPTIKDVPVKLNPILANIWPRVIARTKDTVFYCCIEALNLIGTMIHVSPEFLRKRIQDDVMKNILFLLARIQKSTLDQQKGSLNQNQLIKGTYLSSSDCELYVTALKLVGYILNSNVVIKSEDECKLVTCLVGFLNTKLYTPMVFNIANNLLTSLYSRSGDWLWIVLWANLGGKKLEMYDKIALNLVANDERGLMVSGSRKDLDLNHIVGLFVGKSLQILEDARC